MNPTRSLASPHVEEVPRHPDRVRGIDRLSRRDLPPGRPSDRTVDRLSLEEPTMRTTELAVVGLAFVATALLALVR